MKKINYKSLLLTLLLVLLVVFIFFSFTGTFISGIVYKNNKDEISMENKIKNKNKACNDIQRQSFKYVTYTCEEDVKYVIYDKDAKKIGERDKSELKLDEVRELIQEKYPEFKDKEIRVGYGKKKVAYVVGEGTNVLILDFDSLKKVFYMGGE